MGNSTAITGALSATGILSLTGSGGYMKVDATYGLRINNSADTANLLVLDNSGNLGAKGSVFVGGFNSNSGSQVINLYYDTGTDKGCIQSAHYGSDYTDLVLQPSGKNVLVGTTSALVGSERISVSGAANNAMVLKTTDNATAVARLWNSATSGDNPFLTFDTEGSITTRGSITYNRGGGVVAYNTTSDYRAKQVLGDITNSGELIDAMRPYRARMHGASMDISAFVAHELQEVLPYAVTGEKDGKDMQQVNLSSLVPLHTAELQSLRRRVAELEARLH